MGWSMILSKIIKVCYGLLLGMGFIVLMVIILRIINRIWKIWED